MSWEVQDAPFIATLFQVLLAFYRASEGVGFYLVSCMGLFKALTIHCNYGPDSECNLNSFHRVQSTILRIHLQAMGADFADGLANSWCCS